MLLPRLRLPVSMRGSLVLILDQVTSSVVELILSLGSVVGQISELLMHSFFGVSWSHHKQQLHLIFMLLVAASSFLFLLGGSFRQAPHSTTDDTVGGEDGADSGLA